MKITNKTVAYFVLLLWFSISYYFSSINNFEESLATVSLIFISILLILYALLILFFLLIGEIKFEYKIDFFHKYKTKRNSRIQKEEILDRVYNEIRQAEGQSLDLLLRKAERLEKELLKS